MKTGHLNGYICFCFAYDLWIGLSWMWPVLAYYRLQMEKRGLNAYPKSY